MNFPDDAVQEKAVQYPVVTGGGWRYALMPDGNTRTVVVDIAGVIPDDGEHNVILNLGMGISSVIPAQPHLLTTYLEWHSRQEGNYGRHLGKF